MIPCWKCVYPCACLIGFCLRANAQAMEAAVSSYANIDVRPRQASKKPGSRQTVSFDVDGSIKFQGVDSPQTLTTSEALIRNRVSHEQKPPSSNDRERTSALARVQGGDSRQNLTTSEALIRKLASHEQKQHASKDRGRTLVASPTDVQGVDSRQNSTASDALIRNNWSHEKKDPGGKSKETPISLVEALQHHLDRLRSHAQHFSLGALVLTALSCFVFGILATLFSIQVFKREPGSRQEAEASVQHVEAEHLMASAATLLTRASAMFDPLVELVQDSASLDELICTWDFETYDSEEQKFRRWQWCTDKEIDQLGVLLEAPTTEFEDYTKVYVNPTAKHVERALVNAEVDLVKFDRNKNLECLLWQLLRAEAYFMMNMSNKKLLLMVESVRLRWTYNDHVLIQQADATFIGAKPSLPGIEKPSSESPTVAAMRMWTEIFKMPAAAVSFVEDSMEDREIDGYKGFRCVERAYFVEVKLLTEDLAVLGEVGLPMYTNFATTNHSDCGHDANVARSFSWMTIKMARSSGVCVPDFEHTSSIDLRCDTMQNTSEADRIAQLRHFLTESGLDTSSWEVHEGKRNKLALLAKELATGKCFVNRTSKGLHRVVSLLACRIRSPSGKLTLVEKGSKYASGEEEWQAQLPGAKKDNAETLLEVTRRICNEKLGWTEDDFSPSHEDSWEFYEYTERSSRYTGLVTKYQKFFADAFLEDDEELLKRVGLDGRQ